MEEKTKVIKHLKTEEDFKKIIGGEKPVLIDFFAVWCGPCQMMKPILEDMIDKYKNIDKVEIAEVDIDELRDIALSFNVMSVPTFMFFKDGKPVETHVGMRSQADIEAKLDELVAK